MQDDQEQQTIDMPRLELHLPLDGADWLGPNGASWRDIALDSSGESAIVYVRRQMFKRSCKYFLVVSVVKAHVLAYELTLEEAKVLYGSLPCRAPYEKAFDVEPLENVLTTKDK